MPKGESVADLYASIGIDLTELDADLIKADKTVQQNMTSIKQKLKNSKLQMAVDISNLGPAASQSDILAVKEKALTEQLHLQAQAVKLLNAEYQKSVDLKGKNSYESQKLQSNLLREQQSLSQIRTQMQAAQPKSGLASALGNAAANVGTSLGLDTGKVATVATVAATAGPHAAIAAGVALTAKEAANLAGSAMTAGASLQEMANRMGISAEQAAMLDRMLKVEDVDTQSFITTMMRMDKQALNAGANGNEVTKTLQQFGVSVTDANGNLLPFTDQLDNLAQGYSVAAAAGKQEAYVTQLLGSRGAALIPILQNYTKTKELANQVASSDLPAEKAKELVEQTKILKMQAGSLGNALGAVFIPLANELIPLATGALKDFTEGIKTVRSYLPDLRAIIKVATNPKAVPGNMGEWYEAAKSEVAAEDMAQKEKLALTEKANKEKASMLGLFNNQEVEQDKKLAEQKQKAQDSISIETYRITHNSVENQMLDIQTKAQEFRTKGVDEVAITQYTEAAKAKVIEDFNNTTAAKLQEVNQTELESKLAAIEREKEAYRQKGVDEVAATQWAEEQKGRAVQNAALNIIRQDKARLDAYKQAAKEATGYNVGYGIDVNGNRVEFNFSNPDAVEKLKNQEVQKMRDKLGIKPGESYQLSDFTGYEKLMQDINMAVIPGMGSNSNSSQQRPINSNVTIKIDNPVLTDTAGISELADKVADKIQPAIESALGGNGNGY